MRTYALTIAAAAFFALPTSAFSQNVKSRPGGVRIEPGYHGRSVARSNCREMRKACLNKEELGERGQGNCQQYRRMCGRD